MAQIHIRDDLLNCLKIRAERQGISLESLLDRCLATSPELASATANQTLAALSAEYMGAIEVRPDKTLVVKWLSPSFTLMTGYTLDDLLKAGGVGSLIHPEDRAAFRSVFSELLIQPTQKIIRYRGITKDGRLLYLEGHYQSIWGEAEGRVTDIYVAVRDVTELTQAQAAYRAVVENSVQAFFIVQEGRTVFANQQTCLVTGYSLEELLSMTPQATLALVHPDDRKRVVELDEAVTSGRHSGHVPIIYRIVHKDGAIRWVEAYFTGTDHQGKPALLGAYIDITERKAAETALEQSRARMQALFDHALNGILLADDEGHYLDANPAACRMLDYTREELTQMSSSDVVAEPGTLQTDREEFHAAGNFMGEYRLRRRDGTILDTEVHSVRHILPGVNLAIVRDVTERKQAEAALRESEQRFRAIFENNLDALLLATNEGDFLAANPAACRLLGGTEAQICTLNRSQILDIADPHAQSVMRERDQTGQFYGEVEFIRLDGTRVPVEVAVMRFEDAAYPQGLVVVSARDITKRKLAEEALRESETRLRMIVQNLPILVNAFDEDGKIIFWNREAERITGYAAEEVLGMSHVRLSERLYHLDHLRTMMAEWGRRGHDYRDWEWELVDREGNPRTVAFSDVSTAAPIPGWAFWTVGVDVTRRKQAEVALATSNDFLRRLIQQIPVGIQVFDVNGMCVEANQAHLDLFGVTYEQIVRRFNIFADEYAGQVGTRGAAERALLGETTQLGDLDFDFRYSDPRFTASSGQHTINVTIFPVFNEAGQVVNFVGLNLDVTERRRQEAALRESEARFRTIFEHSPDVIFLGTNDGGILAANPAACQMLGYSETEWVGKHRSDFVVMDERTERVITERRRTGVGRGELDYIHRDGRLIPVEVTTSSLGSPDDPDSLLVSVARDIGERKRQEIALRESEQRFRAIFENNLDALLLMTEEGDFLAVNPAACQLLGGTEAQICGLNRSQILDMNAPPVQALLRERAATGRYRGELEVIRLDGVPVPVEVVVMQFDYTAYPQGLVVVSARDIRERKRAEQARQQAELLQAQLDKEREMRELKSRFLGMVTHEFRTPMTVLVLNMEALRRDESPEKRVTRLDRIDAQLQRLNRMIEDIALVNKNELLEHELDLTALELTDFFGHIIDEVSMSYQNGVHFDLQLVGDFTGRYDEWLLREIFGNLISNAVKYSHPNGLVEIYGTRQAETFTVTIRDHGIGIAEEDQSHLFEAFYRAANARHISGTGLGLVIVKQAVDAYGGTISFESQEGVGTTFTVQLLFHPLDEG